MNFYELQGPTKWADPPANWSSTSLDEVEACPRRWQLLRSQWGVLDRFPVRQRPATIEGQIVHEALDRLARACGQRGNPAFGSEQFSAALTAAEFFPHFMVAVTEWQRRLAAHPRPGPVFRLRTSGEELANRTIRLFREQYRSDGQAVAQTAERATTGSPDVNALLRCKHAVSEVRLTHPGLPFVGILDRVQLARDGVEVVDFKTGRPCDQHRVQLLRYALLWWRRTGDAPVRVIAQYLNGTECWPVSIEALEEIEASLATQLPLLTEVLRARPAVAKPGTGCPLCPVRARCSPGWAINEEAARAEGRGDAELVLTALAGDHGFLARSTAGSEIAVVYEAQVGRLLSEHVEGQTLRVVDGLWKDRQTQLELKAWSEVFVVSSEAAAVEAE